MQACIHCVISNTKDLVSEPLAISLYGQAHNNVAHKRHQYMDESNMKYVLVIKVYLSSNPRLHSYKVQRATQQQLHFHDVRCALQTGIGFYGVRVHTLPLL